MAISRTIGLVTVLLYLNGIGGGRDWLCVFALCVSTSGCVHLHLVVCIYIWLYVSTSGCMYLQLQHLCGQQPSHIRPMAALFTSRSSGGGDIPKTTCCEDAKYRCKSFEGIGDVHLWYIECRSRLFALVCLLHFRVESNSITITNLS